MQNSVHPYEVAMLTRVLSLLPAPRVEDAVLDRVHAMLPQCSLMDLNAFTVAIARWMRNDAAYGQNSHSKYVRLLQSVNRHAVARVHAAERLDRVMDELKYMSGEWFEEVLLEETVAVLQRLADQLTWIVVPELALLLNRVGYRCTRLLDRLALVALESVNKVCRGVGPVWWRYFCLMDR